MHDHIEQQRDSVTVMRFPQKPASMQTLPFLIMPSPLLELFDPNDPTLLFPPLPKGVLPLCHAARNNTQRTFIPREEDCTALWNAYGMLNNIRNHSFKVAYFARDIARMRNLKGGKVDEDAAFAAGLLHDLGKTYSIEHCKGNHAQAGAAWVMKETRNALIARAVLFHVYWPWQKQLDQCINNDDFFLPLVIAYADKRVRHDSYVTIDERYDDLQDRYGVTAESRQHIELSRAQGKYLETAYSNLLEISLETYTPDCRGLVS